jgi:hypothetical protein
MDAAPGGRDDIVEAEKLRTKRASVSAQYALKPLFAIGWPQQVERINDLVAEPFEQFERGDAHFRKESVDIAGDEKPDAHDASPLISQASRTSC